jgi:hypothetical protein
LTIISRIVITNGKAKNMLENVIRKSTIYQHPQDYILGKDTFYVESFNNVMNSSGKQCLLKS